MKNIESIFLAGEGHSAIAAYKSLIKYFSKIEIVSKDKNLLSLKRPQDVVVEDIEFTNSKIGVCAGYKKLIPRYILNKKLIINTHPSLLPKYRGLHSLVWAMLNFEEELGFTVHLMNEKMDDGDILAQYKVKYTGQTSWEIMLEFDKWVEENLGRVIYDFLQGKIKPKPQNIEEATWVPRRNIEDCIIDFHWNIEFLERFFKALVEPYPLPMLKIKNELYEILEYRLLKREYYTHIGRVVNIQDNWVYIKVKDGLLLVKKLRNFKTREVINATQILKIGQRL